MGILFYGKVCPLDAVEHHNIIGLGHPQFLIEAQSVLVVAGVRDDVVFAAGQPVKLLYHAVLGTQIGVLEKINVFLSRQSLFFDRVFHSSMQLLARCSALIIPFFAADVNMG